MSEADYDKDKFQSHPDFPIRQEILDGLKKANMEGNFDLADILTERLTVVERTIHRAIGTQNPTVTDPIFEKLDNTFAELREAKRTGDKKQEEELWSKIASIHDAISAKYDKSKNN